MGTLAKQNYDLTLRLEEAESGGSRTIKAQMRKLENRIAELESDLDSEARNSANVLKSTRKTEKRVKEAELALEDEKRNSASHLTNPEIVVKKMKLIRGQLEDAEAQIDVLQTKVKKAELSAEESEERAAAAETANVRV